MKRMKKEIEKKTEEDSSILPTAPLMEEYSESTVRKRREKIEEENDKEEILLKVDHDDYQRPAKLDLIVGFLRFLNYLSSCTAIFGICLSLYFPLSESEEDILEIKSKLSPEQQETLGYVPSWKLPPAEYRWILFIKTGAGIIQLAYLLCTAVYIIIDNIATMTFRWKEYGELTHRHTDATSVLFLFCKARWKMRLLAALSIASALSLHTTHIILRLTFF
ncbi:uncharacterized protein LOC111710221 [Eurytemora carolleeae]|uniref:uncharacterized protein LOC111710221 n=1 Tax=Eurytemora carolleeae TaxID=1294199 RepID=UPI000C783CD4|nr:uncharacterized protein LOC111710221 [Eurytemora carolleeae]|eukprot:XP_023340051.1 uncharacterized protein LOC111710221 [Eurytemora affinis]